jgi:hypothetical protein
MKEQPKDERPTWVFGDTLLWYAQGRKENGSFERIYLLITALAH